MAVVAGSWRLELYTLFCSMIFTLRGHSGQRCRWWLGHVFGIPFASLGSSSTHRPARGEFGIMSSFSWNWHSRGVHSCSLWMWSSFSTLMNRSISIASAFSGFLHTYEHTDMSLYCRSCCLHLILIKYCLRWLIDNIWNNFHILRILLYDKNSGLEMPESL